MRQVRFYIVEYEQRGADRARYGEGLLEKLACALASGIVEMQVQGQELTPVTVRYPRLYRRLGKATGSSYSAAIRRPPAPNSATRAWV
jgi:hypothetical protein